MVIYKIAVSHLLGAVGHGPLLGEGTSHIMYANESLPRKFEFGVYFKSPLTSTITVPLEGCKIPEDKETIRALLSGSVSLDNTFETKYVFKFPVAVSLLAIGFWFTGAGFMLITTLAVEHNCGLPSSQILYTKESLGPVYPLLGVYCIWSPTKTAVPFNGWLTIETVNIPFSGSESFAKTFMVTGWHWFAETLSLTATGGLFIIVIITIAVSQYGSRPQVVELPSQIWYINVSLPV